MPGPCNTALVSASRTDRPVLTRTQPPVRETIEIAVPPRVAYDAVSDPRNMSRWSPENTGARLLSPGPLTVGSKFSGSNQRWLSRWSTTCTVVAADPGRKFIFDVSFAGFPVARWGYEFEATPAGCRVTETWSDTRTGVIGTIMKSGGLALTGVLDRSAHNREGMRATLAALKAELESR